MSLTIHPSQQPPHGKAPQNISRTFCFQQKGCPAMLRDHASFGEAKPAARAESRQGLPRAWCAACWPWPGAARN
jgi:hypothetical protein